MPDKITLTPIAHLRGDFPNKFGVPRQSGLVDALESRVIFEPPFRDPNALRGIEQFSHLWLIWHFSQSAQSGWSPTVRPPKLGGNIRIGVFATRSPFRPNPIGLSCVRLLGTEHDPELGPILRVAGADLVDGTPILDIKPYIPYADARPEASPGYTAQTRRRTLRVNFPEPLLERVPEPRRAALLGALAQDPRPGYQNDPERVYGMNFAGLEVRFRVEGERLEVLEVREI